jgi:hypothetical protein
MPGMAASRWAVLVVVLAGAPAARAEWQPLAPPEAMEGACRHLFFLSARFGALVDDGNHLFISTDEGDSWLQRPPARRGGAALAPHGLG